MHYAEGSLMNWLVMKLVFMTIPKQPMPFFVRPIARALCGNVQAKLIDPNLATAPCGASCHVLDPAGALPGTVNINGNSLPNAPRWIASVTARYGIPFGDGEFFAFTDWSYRSRTNFFLYDSVEFQSPNRVEGGLRVGYSYKGGQWEAAVFGRNITNDVSLEGAIDFDNLTGFVNDPRTWGVELKGKF